MKDIDKSKIKDDCDDCKRYAKSVIKGRPLNCFKAEDYLPAMIFYCRLQMRWACSYLPSLEDNIWPLGRIYDAISSSQVKIPSKAAMELAMEVNIRLKTCGKDGKDLVFQLVNNGLDTILTERASNALNYISGWRRRKQSYIQWQAENRRSKPIKNMVFSTRLDRN